MDNLGCVFIIGGVVPSFATSGREWGEFVSGGSPLPELQELVLHLLGLDLQVEFDFSLTFVWVPRDLNVRADYLSHVSAMRHHHYCLREEWLAYLDGLRGHHTIDRFASADNCQPLGGPHTGRFCSQYFHPDAEWTDALSLHWGHENNWAFPLCTSWARRSHPGMQRACDARLPVGAMGVLVAVPAPQRACGGWARDAVGATPLGPPDRVLDVSAHDLRLLRSGPMIALRFGRSRRRLPRGNTARRGPPGAIAARRAGQLRRLKALVPSALRMVAAAMQLRAPAARGGGTLPPSRSAAVIRLAARGKSPASWNRYASVLRQWETYAVRVGTPFLPADPTHFATFLAEAAAGARGDTQSKQQACAIAAFSALAGVPSPVDDALVRDVRSSATSFLPRAPSLLPLGGGGRARGGWPRVARTRPPRSGSGRSRKRCAARRSSSPPASGSTASRRVRSASRDDRSLDLGLKDRLLLAGQAAVLSPDGRPRRRRRKAPATAAKEGAGDGVRAFLEGTRLCLDSGAPARTPRRRALAARFRADCTPRDVGRGAAELDAWPEDIRALAAPLYRLGLPVHCLPIYGQWQHARLGALSDLREPVPTSVFLRRSSPRACGGGRRDDGLRGA